MFTKCRKPKPQVRFDKNYEEVYITFQRGETVVIRRDLCANVDVDDRILRAAHDMSVLDSTALPQSICCPISKMPMSDPVMCADGFSYERSEIKKWMTKNNTSPITGMILKHFYLAPNHALRNTIRELIVKDDESLCVSASIEGCD